MPLFEQKQQHIPSTLLRSRFGWPPFSILNTIKPEWQKRKDEWETVIEDSTEGRDLKRNNALPTNIFNIRCTDPAKAESISTFDPYLCELMYKWFSRDGDSILDPFAGGSVRGSVAAILGRDYTGIDLSEEQVSTNEHHWDSIQSRYTDIRGTVSWKLGDSDEKLGTDEFMEEKYNMIFTCPPYYNLEKYTKDPRDLSRLKTYEDFLKKYTSILYKASKCLAENSFFVIVVSEIRAEVRGITNSYYLGLVPDTIQILKNTCKLKYYNEIILENNIGSLPMRAPKNFDRTRKIGRHHQNILVFYKGDLAKIEDKFGKVSV